MTFAQARSIANLLWGTSAYALEPGWSRRATSYLVGWFELDLRYGQTPWIERAGFGGEGVSWEAAFLDAGVPPGLLSQLVVSPLFPVDAGG